MQDTEQHFKLPELKKLVANSEFFIVVLTEGYLSSKWCLAELKTAIKYKKKVNILFAGRSVALWFNIHMLFKDQSGFLIF